jgi:hypothetical protein
LDRKNESVWKKSSCINGVVYRKWDEFQVQKIVAYKQKGLKLPKDLSAIEKSQAERQDVGSILIGF